MKHQNNVQITELIVHGLVVRLIFSEQGNTSAPGFIREILKASYLQRNSG